MATNDSVSSSDSDDYYPEQKKVSFLPRCKLLQPLVGDWSGAMARAFSKLAKRGKACRSNSDAQKVELEDVRHENPLRLRKNSCNCPFCGGSKLSTLVQQTLLPKQESHYKTFGVSVVSHTPDVDCAPDLVSHTVTAGRLSMLVTEGARTMFVKPPETPALIKYMNSLDRPIIGNDRKNRKHKSVFIGEQKKEKSKGNRSMQCQLSLTPSTTFDIREASLLLPGHYQINSYIEERQDRHSDVTPFSPEMRDTPFRPSPKLRK